MIGLIHLFFQLLWVAIIFDIILSWVALAGKRPRWTYHPIVRLIQEIAFQTLRPFRKLLERLGLRMSPIDFSPILAILALQVIESLVIGLLHRIGF